MKETITNKLLCARVRYTGTCEKGAYKGDPVEGYGFYCDNGRCYIYGHRAEEKEKDTRWHRVKSDSVEFIVVTRPRCAS